MTTFAEAKTALYGRLVSGWVATPIHLDGESFEPQVGQPFLYALLIGERSRQDGLREVGSRPFRRESTFRVQRRSPPERGTVDEDAWIQAMKDLFEGVTVDGVYCTVAQVRPALRDGAWRLRTFEIDVWYVDRR